MTNDALAGVTSIVTGGSRGIGLAIARIFAEEGANVIITSRDKDVVGAAAEGLRRDTGSEVLAVAGNAGDPEHAQEVMELAVTRFGACGILVNSAATNPFYGSIVDIDDARARKTVEVNFLAMLRWSQLAWHVGGMAEKGGAIVNIASTGGLSTEYGIGFYNTTKAAVIHMTKQMALDMGPAVRVNAVAPGLVKTDMARELWVAKGQEIAEVLPLKRIGEPRDIAQAALFLASEASSWITGHTLVVDGGALVKSII